MLKTQKVLAVSSAVVSMAASILHGLSCTGMHSGLEGDLQWYENPGLAYLVVLWHTAGNASPSL